MRSSATRIVLAALAVIVGVVLALPMLLSRKAEAAAGVPLAVDGDGGVHGLVRSRLKVSCCRDIDGAEPNGTAGIPSADLAHQCSPLAAGGGIGQDDRLLYAIEAAFAGCAADLPVQSRLAALIAPSWSFPVDWELAKSDTLFPLPLLLAENRKYHMRP